MAPGRRRDDLAGLPPREGDGPARWWLWDFLGPDTACFVMDATRSGVVLARHAGIDEKTHRDCPMTGLDSNPAERALRRSVVTRKNAYGSRNEDAARLAARIWTVTATAQMAGLNVLTYLDECGRNSGKPPAGPDLERSCPGMPHPETSAPGHSRPARITARKRPP